MIQQDQFGRSRSQSISEENYSRITQTLVKLDGEFQVDKYRKNKLLDKLGHVSPQRKNNSRHTRSLASSPTNLPLERNYEQNNNTFAIYKGKRGNSHSILDVPKTAWKPPNRGIFSIPAQFYDRYEDMYALKQDDFYLTGFKPDSIDPQKDTKNMLKSLSRKSHEEPISFGTSIQQ